MIRKVDDVLGRTVLVYSHIGQPGPDGTIVVHVVDRHRCVLMGRGVREVIVVIAEIADAVVIKVILIRVGGFGAVVLFIDDAVAVTVLARVADAVIVEIFLTGIGREPAVVQAVDDAVLVGVQLRSDGDTHRCDPGADGFDHQILVDVDHDGHLDVLVANDTGPVHLASALGVPVLGLYGPNTPRLYGPLSPGSISFYDAPPCSPCITNLNYKTSRCRNPVCIRAIEVDKVAAAAGRLLEARAEQTA